MHQPTRIFSRLLLNLMPNHQPGVEERLLSEVLQLQLAILDHDLSRALLGDLRNVRVL